DDVTEAMNRERARRRDAIRDDFERVDLRRRAARNGYAIMTDEAGKVYITNPATNQLLPVEDWAGAEEWLNGHQRQCCGTSTDVHYPDCPKVGTGDGCDPRCRDGHCVVYEHGRCALTTGPMGIAIVRDHDSIPF